MAKQLILDTSAKYLVVALAENDKIIDKIQYIAWQRQSEFTALEIQNILKRPCGK
jgi:tRNA A37 threonylcarbamoyladenosine modification protein TsaB